MDCSNSLQSAPVFDLTQSANRWAIPIALLLCVILAFFDKVSIAALFSDSNFLNDMGLISAEGQTDRAKLGLLMTVFLLSYGFSSTFLSFIGDLISPIKLLMWMMISWGLIMLLMSMSTSYSGLLWGRIALGIAEGPLFAVAYTIVKKTFKPREQARATMLWLLGTPIGASLGFPITIMVMHQFGWRATFIVMAAMTLFVILIAYAILRSVDLNQRHSAGILETAPNLSFKYHVAASRALLKTPLFWLACLFNVALLGYLWGINTWWPSYLKDARGLSTMALGLFTSLPFIAMLAGEIFGAFVSDRLGKRALICMIAVGGAGVGLIAVVLLGNNMLMLMAMSVSMFCWGLAPPSVFPLLSKVVDPRVSATAGGIFNGLGNFASALIPWIIGILVAYFNSMNAVILLLAVVSLVGGFALIPHVMKKL